MPTASVSRSLPPPPVPGAGDRWALFLDVDGCLLEFADEPDGVLVPPSLHALLQRLQRALGGALALVSGRALADLDRLFAAPAWAMAGLHGHELRGADGAPRAATSDPAQQAHMRQAVHALAARLEGVQIEDKKHAIALHCRRAPGQLAALRAAAEALAAELPGYDLQPGNLVMEFKPAGVDKGRAVDELLAQAPFAGRTPVVLGDDLTDEHAFAAADRAGGISVRVGSREPTQAKFTLPSPSAVHAWLARVADALEHPQGEPIHAHVVGGHAEGQA